ncbi:MAG: response regulator transcription factor [Rudanella sp.]|nr:response regulator transcription factor [Rudanella sp.]
MSTTTIAIADDHQLLAQALSDLVQKFEGYDVLYVAENGRDLIERFPKQGIPDILLLDVNMPEMDGFETATYLQKHHPDLKILVLSMIDRDEQVAQMIRLGVRGYLLKGCRPAELREALDDIRTKGFYYSEFLTHHLLKSLQVAKVTVNTPTVHFNERELQFLKLACSDLTYAQIADEMCVGVRTVDGYREAIFQKLHVKSRVGMVMEALRLGLITL